MALRLARDAVKVDRAEGLVTMMRDVGRVQSKAGTRAALDGLRLAEEPRDMARIARVAATKGGKTRAVMKVLGRGAIALTTGLFDLTLWVFWAVAHLLGFCVTLKRLTERITLWAIARGKHRRARLLANAQVGVYGRNRYGRIATRWLIGRRITSVRRGLATAP